MLTEIKNHLLFYGEKYDWVKNDLVNLADEALKMLSTGEAKNAEDAAYLTIDKRF